jgi:hypothetical protein
MRSNSFKALAERRDLQWTCRIKDLQSACRVAAAVAAMWRGLVHQISLAWPGQARLWQGSKVTAF